MPSTSPMHARVEPGQRAGVAHAVGGRHLGRSHGPRVPDGLIGQGAARCEEGFAERGVGPKECGHQLQHLVVARVGEDVDAQALRDHAHDRGNSALLLRGQADPEVEAKWLGDLVAEVRADRAAGDAADDLAHQPAEGGGVVAVTGAGDPVGVLVLQRLDHRLPRQRLLRREHAVDPGEAGLVREQMADGDVLLAVLAELGPVAHHRRVDVEPTLLGEPVGADRRRSLGRREDQDDRVVVPWPPGRLVGDPAPQVHHRLTPVGRPRTPTPSSVPSAKPASKTSRTCSNPGAVQPEVTPIRCFLSSVPSPDGHAPPGH